MNKQKQNCWEYFNCDNKEKDFCQVFKGKKYDGLNHGKNGGRFCWAIIGTFSGNKSCIRYDNCFKCPFFSKVEREEERDFILNKY